MARRAPVARPSIRTVALHPAAGAAVVLVALLAASSSAQSPSLLHGRVSDIAGLPVAGADVRLEGAGMNSTTDAEGRFRIPGLRPGTFRLTAAAPGLATASVEVRVPREGETVRRDLVLGERTVLGEEVLTLVERGDAGPADGRWVLRRGDLTAAGSVARALARVPGVFVKEFGAGGAREVSIRGGAPDQTLILWGEEPLASAGGGGVDLRTLPGGAIDSIEVLTRGASSRYGPGALAGVVRIHPASAKAERLRVAARLSAGSLGERGASGELGVAAAGAIVEGGGSLRALERNFGRRENAGGEERGGALSLRVPAAGFTLAAAGHASRLGAPGPVPNPTPRATTSARRLLASLTWTRDGVGWGARAEASAQLTDAEYENRDRPAARADSRETAVSGRAGATLEVGGHRLEGGLAARRERTGGASIEGRPRRSGLAAYLADRWRPGPGWLAVSPALRVDRIAVDGGADAAAGARRDGAASPDVPAPVGAAGDSATSRVDLFVSPSLSVAAEPAAGLSVRASAGRSFRYPEFGSLFFLSGIGVRSNPALREERSRDLELALEWAPSRRLAASAAVFDRRLEGAIVWLPDFQFVWSPRNLPGAVARGVEVAARWRPAPAWEVSGTYAYAPARFDFRGNRNPLPYRPAHLARLELAGHAGPLRSEVEVRITGRRFPNLAGTNPLDAYALADWSVAWRRRVGDGGVELGLRVENLLDRRYDVVFGYPGAGRSVAMSLAYGPP